MELGGECAVAAVSGVLRERQYEAWSEEVSRAVSAPGWTIRQIGCVPCNAASRTRVDTRAGYQSRTAVQRFAARESRQKIHIGTYAMGSTEECGVMPAWGCH